MHKRREKNKRAGFKTSYIYLLVVLTLFLIAVFAATHVLKGKSSLEQGGAGLIDLDRSVAVIDFFELTYVRIYLHDSLNADSVMADGEPLSYNEEHERWELITDRYNEEDRVVVTVTTGGDAQVVQQEEFVVSRL